MKKVTFLLAAILFLGVSNIAKAVATGDKKTDSHNLYIRVDKQAMVSVVGSGTTDLRFESEAISKVGGEVTFKATNGNNSLWLNYSSIVSSQGTNSISASISSLPKGLKVQVVASAKSADGAKGQTGTGKTAYLKTGTGATIVDDIKSCYTGTGERFGHKLVYSVVADGEDYDKIVEAAGGQPFVVTYTITEN